MKSILAALLITTSVFGQNINPISDGPVYDPKGLMIEYHYPDGTQESYAYDDALRMIRFTDRAGGVTTFVYTRNGSMTTIMPDGTTRN
jgi:YD repeat-containing protein